MESIHQSNKIFNVYPATRRPTPKWSHQQHRKNIRLHQDRIPPIEALITPSIYAKNQPEHTENQPGKQAPAHLPVHTTSTHQCPLTCSGQRYPKAAHSDECRGAKPTCQNSVHTDSTRSPLPAEAHPRGHEHPPAQSAQPPQRNPRNPKANKENPNDKGTKQSKCKGESKVGQLSGNVKFIWYFMCQIDVLLTLPRRSLKIVLALFLWVFHCRVLHQHRKWLGALYT